MSRVHDPVLPLGLICGTHVAADHRLVCILEAAKQLLSVAEKDAANAVFSFPKPPSHRTVISKGTDMGGVLVIFLAEKELGAPNFSWNSHFPFFYSEFTHIQDSVES